MDFLKPTFIFFFLPILMVIFGLAERRFRVGVLLAASLLFVAWGQPVALLWLGTLLIVSYGAAILIARRPNLAWLWLGLAFKLLVLIFFKWKTYFSLELLGFPQDWARAADALLVPLGLSYITFQVIAYLVDVWKGIIPAERNFLRLALYVFFFPKLISGPITRYKSFGEQLDVLAPTADDVAAGIRRFLTGFAKRALIANVLATTVDAGFGMSTPNYTTLTAWLVFIGYALQIYFDFSGYTDMALGLARMAGIKLPENFNLPYLAESISDFWRRWHITLSTWFREYVFFPLERRRLRWIGQPLNILIVFALTGLWHGFKPTFVTWGLIHGAAIVLESLFLGRFLKKLWLPLRWLYALTIVLSAWVFFRASSLDFALAFFQRLAGYGPLLVPMPFADTRPLPFLEPSFLLALGLGLFFCLPVGAWWTALRSRLEARAAVSFILFQALEDLFLLLAFVLGLVFVLGSGFAPNIYANF